MGSRGLEGGGPYRGGPEPFLRDPGRLLYLCRSGSAQNGGGQTAGAGGGWGTPGMGREAVLCCAALLRRLFTSLPGSARPGTRVGPCLEKSCLTPLHWAEDLEEPFGEAEAAPSPAAQGLPRLRRA